MGYLTEADKAAREIALETKRQKEAAAAEAEATKRQQAATVAKAIHQKARKAIVDSLFDSLQFSYLKGDEPYIGTTSVARVFATPTSYPYTRLREPEQNPVYEALAGGHGRRLVREEMAAIQALINEIDDAYRVSHQVETRVDRYDDGYPVMLTVAVSFTLQLRAES